MKNEATVCNQHGKVRICQQSDSPTYSIPTVGHWWFTIVQTLFINTGTIQVLYFMSSLQIKPFNENSYEKYVFDSLLCNLCSDNGFCTLYPPQINLPLHVVHCTVMHRNVCRLRGNISLYYMYKLYIRQFANPQKLGCEKFPLTHFHREFFRDFLTTRNCVLKIYPKKNILLIQLIVFFLLQTIYCNKYKLL